MKIFLIGLPGSGKTTLGKQVASRLEIPFIDLDKEIEKAEALTVQEIFALQGENIFRKKESECLKSFAGTENNFVMATGGGTPCYFENMNLMNEAGFTIFLDAPIQEIASRLQKTDLKKRPLFDGLSNNEVAEKLEVLRLQRVLFYNKAQKIISRDKISTSDILDSIKA